MSETSNVVAAAVQTTGLYPKRYPFHKNRMSTNNTLLSRNVNVFLIIYYNNGTQSLISSQGEGIILERVMMLVRFDHYVGGVISNGIIFFCVSDYAIHTF